MSWIIEPVLAAVLGSWALAYVVTDLPRAGRHLANRAATELGAAMELWRPWAGLLVSSVPFTRRPVVWAYTIAWQAEASLRHAGGATVLVVPDQLAARRALRGVS